MVFFVFGITTRRNIPSNAAELLQGYESCLLCRASPVRVVETRRSCHWCFIPLVPISTALVVVCSACNVPVKLEAHVQQWSLRGPPAAGGKGASSIPVATMVGIVRGDDGNKKANVDHNNSEIVFPDNAAVPVAVPRQEQVAYESEPLVEAKVATALPAIV